MKSKTTTTAKTKKSTSTNEATQNERAESLDTPMGEVFLKELKDIYWAEKHLTKALPKLAKAVTNQDLRNAFEDHIEQTEGQIQRLEEVFNIIGVKAVAKKCEAMEGLVREGQDHITSLEKGDGLDAALISATQKIEHYEIATYGTLRTFARVLGMEEVANLLQETLDEEGETDKLLTSIAESSVNQEAAMEDEE